MKLSILKNNHPLDHPYPGRTFRIYLALTNHCNRACPWCSTFSSPDKKTFFQPKNLNDLFPKGREVDLQLEGGEPMVHPQFWDIIRWARRQTQLKQILLCTNGTRIPRTPDKLFDFINQLGCPLTLKLSINHHLLEQDPGLWDLACELKNLKKGVTPFTFIINLRFRPDPGDPDLHLIQKVKQFHLEEVANIFPLQAYGLAAKKNWEKPFLAGENFILVNPNGSSWGTELIARSENMGFLP